MTSSGSIEIGAPIEHVFATITDFDNVASWQRQCISADVEERDELGRAVVVRLKADLKVKQPSYRNRYTYDAPTSLRFELIDGDIKAAEGGYALSDLGAGRTKVDYEADVDPGFFVPAPIRRKVAAAVIKDLLGQLKARAEATAPRDALG